MSRFPPGATVDGKVTELVDPICVPDSKNMVYEVDQVQVPMFLNFHVFVNVALGS